VHDAVIQESTTVMRAVGNQSQAPRHLATALAAGDLHLIVGLTVPVQDGTRVAIFERNNAPIAMPEDSLSAAGSAEKI
jgi:hypothetical protein